MTHVIEHRQAAAPGETVLELRLFRTKAAEVRAYISCDDVIIDTNMMMLLSRPAAEAFLDALALLERGVASLSVWDVDQARAADLAQRLQAVTSVEISIAPPGAACDVAINATPLGMDEGDPVPVSLAALPRHAVIADAIMKPPRTKLLREAELRGHPIQEGRHMLDNQVETIWSFFGLP
jgi:hypothetical protein